MESGSREFSNIEISAKEIRIFLTNVHENNLFWDLGFQFTVLKETQKENSDNVPTTCYCPCSNFMKTWRSHFNLQDIMSHKEVNYCRSRGVFNTPKAFYDHCESMGSSCIIHQGLTTYIDMQYRIQLKNLKKNLK